MTEGTATLPHGHVARLRSRKLSSYSSPCLPKILVGQKNELRDKKRAPKRPADDQENQFDVDMRFSHGCTSSGPRNDGAAMDVEESLASMASFHTLATASSVA